MDRSGYSKKKVPSEEQKRNLQKAAMQEVLPGYEDYLVLLQERNRLLKKMRKKSKKQIDNERKEQGFSIYVSGANAGKQKQRVSSHQEERTDSPEPITERQRLKTAGDVSQKRVISHRDLEVIAAEEKRKIEEKKRVKTAPARERRRNWLAGSVNIKTERGEKCHLKAPEIVTGNYEDDFEDSEDEEGDKKHKKFNSAGEDDDSDSEIEIDASKFTKSPVKTSQPKNVPSRTVHSAPTVQQRKSKAAKNKPPPPKSESESEEENEKLMLSIADVKKLRQSLAMNRSIRESLAKEVSSDLSDDEEVPECLDHNGSSQDEGESERASPIPEEDIEEDLVPAMDSVCLEDKQKYKPTSFKPTDTIVLELEVPPSKNKVQKNLSAARKKDLDEDLSEYKSKRKEPLKPTATSQSNQKKPSTRPLSASRISTKTVTDSQEEASAVLEAMRAENEQASKLKKEAPRKLPPTPKQRLRPASAGHIPSSPLPSAEIRPSPRSRDSPRTSVKESNQSTDVGNSVNVQDSFLANDRISEVMKKVLLMQPKQQKRLMKVLSKIDSSVDDDEEKSGRPPSSKPVKAMRPVNDMVNKSSKRSVGKFSPNEDSIEVNLELTSNWGHKNLIGLTEIQFYDMDRQLLPVRKEDVTVHGGSQQQNSIDVLFNGKTKTNKERNMWCCKFRKSVPVEICLSLQTRKPHTEVSRIKIWNHNKSITDLDIGVKHARIFVGGVLVFDGNIEKGCGNQVFDYGCVISLKDNGDKISPRDPGNSPSPISLSPVIHTRSPTSDKASSQRKSQNTHTPSPSADNAQRNPFEQAFTRSSKSNIRSPSPSPRVPPLDLRQNGPSPSSGDGPVIRSETRTMNHAERDIQRPVVTSDRSGSEAEEVHYKGRRNWSPPTGELFDEDPRQFWVDINPKKEDESKVAGKQKGGSKTPRKSKRMAAKLDGHSSTEGEITASNSSKNASESADVRSPKGSGRKPDERPGSVHDKRTAEAAKPSQVEDVKNNTSDESLLQSQDDIPMLQKLKQMNQNSKFNMYNEDSQANITRRPVWLDKMLLGRNKNIMDQKRKKDVPKWLKQEESAGPFENPPSRGGSRQDVPAPLPLKDHMIQQEDVDMLIDEELALWPESGKPDLKTVFDTDKKPPPSSSKSGKESDSATPMKKIQQNRAKWRDNQKKNLEESWGSLNMFDRHQKGRISMDLDDDALDEYLQLSSKKATPNQPSIKEETEEAEPATTTEEDSEDNFVIPELPYGKELVINIKTTWGDKHYVGLTGIELFSSTGESVNVSKITAKPLDINILKDYEKDPRVVTNLIDGVNRTRDDVHMWLAPFSPNGDHFIYLTLEKPCQIALMRIWNYNKSRIHSYRGAKDVEIQLDNNVIFVGEIARACGGIEGGTEAFGDTILFTTDENILEAVSKNDDAYEGDMLDDTEPDDVPFERPSTADAGSDEDRPFTRAQGNLKKEEEASIPSRPATSMVTEGDVIVFKGKSLQLNFTDTWGDLHYLGLTGLEVLGKDGEAFPVSLDMLKASPSDLHHLPGHERDDRTLDKVINGNNVTCADENMWLIPFNEGQNHTLTVNFSQSLMMAGLRVWNYNKSPEDTYRGAKIVHVKIDGKQVSPPDGYLIRKGPGYCYFDFAQEIVFAAQQKPAIPPTSETKMESSVRSSVTDDGEYESVQMPCGFIYQLHLISTWGDPYYVGLNGIEMYDASHNKIELTETNIAAYPDSVNVLANVQNDVRTPDKLIDGVNSTTDGRHMWLAPILPTTLNRVYVIFDQPTAVSMIKIWNYSKTPNRGAKDIALLVDDLLVYNGMLQPVRAGAKGIVPNCDTPQTYHTILFTDNKDIIRKEKHSIISNQAGEQDIQLTNDKIVVGQYNDPKKAQQGKPVNQELRPKTSVVAHKNRR
ncbi:katanin-interacting protein-like [Saccostrea echinata]|uniref:katanin-interacting protein-like n=1 Tax=Saccostrea echinata TaxID=191078 RepID=UPI002A829320|nr:katanin-interacting protein-like [Saccostrea echinata]